MLSNTHNKLILELKKHLFLACFISLSMLSCDNGVQVKRKVIKETVKQDSVTQKLEEKEIVTPAASPIENDSLNVEVLLARGYQYYINKEYEKAFDQYIAVYKIDEKNIAALVGLGNLYYDTQQHTKAIELYQKALELEPNKLDVRCDMATCYFRLGMLEKAIEINNKTIEIDFSHAQSHHNQAVFYKKLGLEKEAAEETKIYNQLISSQHN